MTVTLSEHPGAGWVEITVSGRVTESDMRSIMPRVERFIEANGKIRIVEVIADFEGFDLGSLWPGIAFDYKHMRDITHVAIVCDNGWMGPVSRAAGAVLPLTIRTFTSHERDAARAWVADPDRAAQP